MQRAFRRRILVIKVNLAAARIACYMSATQPMHARYRRKCELPGDRRLNDTDFIGILMIITLRTTEDEADDDNDCKYCTEDLSSIHNYFLLFCLCLTTVYCIFVFDLLLLFAGVAGLVLGCGRGGVQSCCCWRGLFCCFASSASLSASFLLASAN